MSDAAPTADPLSHFLSALERERASTRAYEAGEHIWLANAGLVRACEALGESPSEHNLIRRGEGPGGAELSYGEIVALSGDFYGSPDELFDEAPAALPWLSEANNLGALRRRFSEELRWISGKGVNYPDNNLAYWWNAKSYIELALANDAHFGWHNVLAYCKHHEAALSLALAARAAGEDLDGPSWRRALYTGAFADHFLTDAFAAGHIRVPRAQNRRWAQERGSSAELAAALSKLLHDQDGHIDTTHVSSRDEPHPFEGLRVCNTLGHDWRTRCDGQLFLPRRDDGDLAIEEPVAAVAASFRELLLAYRRGQLPPAGPFAALYHVPFPHPESPTLCAKFAPENLGERLTAILDSINWYSKIPWFGPGLTRECVLEYLAALPRIMGWFRADVAATRDPALARMPSEYVEAFQRIE